MAVLDTGPVRVAVPPIVGGGLVGSLFLPAVITGEAASLRPGLIGAALLLSPYLMFSLAAVRTRAVAWVMLLALLVASTVFGLFAAGSSSTGGLVFLWLLPGQWALSWLAILLTRGALTGLAEGRDETHSTE